MKSEIPSPSQKKIFRCKCRYGRNFIDNFQMEVANEMYDAIKEGGSTRILGHLMRKKRAKSIHTDILNPILLDHLRAPVEDATKIKVFSLQAIEYRITLYSLNMSKNGTFLISELYSTLSPFSFDAISKYKRILYMMEIFQEIRLGMY